MFDPLVETQGLIDAVNRFLDQMEEECRKLDDFHDAVRDWWHEEYDATEVKQLIERLQPEIRREALRRL